MRYVGVGNIVATVVWMNMLVRPSILTLVTSLVILIKALRSCWEFEQRPRAFRILNDIEIENGDTP
jgi:hypothetical protein